jgi:hypothetical protein
LSRLICVCTNMFLAFWLTLLGIHKLVYRNYKIFLSCILFKNDKKKIHCPSYPSSYLGLTYRNTQFIFVTCKSLIVILRCWMLNVLDYFCYSNDCNLFLDCNLAQLVWYIILLFYCIILLVLLCKTLH